MRLDFKKGAILFDIILTLSFIFFSYLMILITLQYVPIKYDVAFLQFKTDEVQLTHYKVAFFLHVYTSVLVLIFGFFQFSNNLRLKFKSFHRTSGKIYIFLILLISSPTGLIMGIYGNGGFYSRLSFCILSLLWFVFTLAALFKAKTRNYLGHQNFMILSYALTLSAISLRLFKWIIVNTLHLPPIQTYKIVVWLGWLFNLSIALIIIKRNLKQVSIPKDNIV